MLISADDDPVFVDLRERENFAAVVFVVLLPVQHLTLSAAVAPPATVRALFELTGSLLTLLAVFYIRTAPSLLLQLLSHPLQASNSVFNDVT
jgi:hypothetical protein